jgi:transcriptional regulator
MYHLPHYKSENQEQVFKFIHEHPFITLTGVDANNYPVATQVPVLIEERDRKLYLLAHIMKYTDHHKAFLQNQNVLAIFTGANTYVSASWYTNQKQGSTWNYRSVHARGKLKFLDEEALLTLLQKLTAHFENNPSSPSLFEHLAPEYVNKLKKAIVAFEIEVTKIDHVFKLSQDRDEESYTNIIEQLSKGNEDAKQMAHIMATRGN